MRTARGCVFALACGLCAIPVACKEGAGGGTRIAEPGEGYTVDLGDPNARYTAQILVLDPEGKPISGAAATTGAVEATSGADGVVKLPGLKPAEFLPVTVEARGFAPFQLIASFARHHFEPAPIVLSPLDLDVAFSAEEGTTLAVGAASVVLPPRALRTAAGALYEGEARARVFVFDPFAYANATGEDGHVMAAQGDPRRSNATFPTGPQPAQLADGTFGQVVLDGSAYVHLESAGGDPLTIASSHRATVRFPIADGAGVSVGAQVPLFTYDEARAQWVAEGACTVEMAPTPRRGPGHGLECAGTVRHFSRVGPGSRFDEFRETGSCVRFVAKVEAPAGVTFTREDVIETCTAFWRNSGSPVNCREFSDSNATNIYRSASGEQVVCGVDINAATQMWLVTTLRFGDGTTRTYESAMHEPTGTSVGIDLLRYIVPRGFGSTDDEPVRAVCEQSDCDQKEITLSLGPGTEDKDGDGAHVRLLPGATLPGGYTTEDCDDNDATRFPGAAEPQCGAKDLNCDGQIPAAPTPATAPSAGHWNTVGCKLSCAVKGAEVAGNAFDEDCDRRVIDEDGDGYLARRHRGADLSGVTLKPIPNEEDRYRDCDDTNADVNPSKAEIASNTVDENCDGIVLDYDGDGYLSPIHASFTATTVAGLGNPGKARVYEDCDDYDVGVFPGNTNLEKEKVFARFYNGTPASRHDAICRYVGSDGTLNARGKLRLIDANCDGWYTDVDGDGKALPGDPNATGGVTADDCNDLDPRATGAGGAQCGGSPATGDSATCKALRAKAPCPARLDSTPTACVDLRGSTQHVCTFTGWEGADPPKLREPGVDGGPCDGQSHRGAIGQCGANLACGGPLSPSPEALAYLLARFPRMLHVSASGQGCTPGMPEAGCKPWVGLCWPLCTP